jgi:hypothetical protein
MPEARVCKIKWTCANITVHVITSPTCGILLRLANKQMHLPDDGLANTVRADYDTTSRLSNRRTFWYTGSLCSGPTEDMGTYHALIRSSIYHAPVTFIQGAVPFF